LRGDIGKDTYQGTAFTLMNNLGWSKAKAEAVEANYHSLYKVSDDYVAERLKQAAKDGYVEVAFGLRVRTPLLKQVMWGGPRVPYAAQAEGRTAGNALGQSYGLLNNRAANAFMAKVWASPFRYDILPVALIHDSIYLLIKDNIDTVAWVNNELILAMQWQELPEIAHDTVKLGANLGIFWPSWANEITLPNQADKPTIRAIADKGKAEYGEKMQTV
jgi:DNA polymerase-1